MRPFLSLTQSIGYTNKALRKGVAAVSGPTGDEVGDVATGWRLLYRLYVTWGWGGECYIIFTIKLQGIACYLFHFAGGERKVK